MEIWGRVLMITSVELLPPPLLGFNEGCLSRSLAAKAEAAYPIIKPKGCGFLEYFAFELPTLKVDYSL